MYIALGVLFAVVFVPFVLLYFTTSIWVPALARLLENDPRNPGRFVATTRVAPGRFKFVMKGGKVARGLMNHAGYKTRGGGTAPENFAVTPLPQSGIAVQEKMGIIDGFFYRHSGYRFFNPFSERIYTYEFPRTEEKMGGNGILEIVGKSDISDYFLLTDQTYSFEIVDADTGRGENVKVTFKGQVTVQIFNPHKAAFAEKKWLQQVIAAIEVRGRNFARARDFDTLLGEVQKEGEELKDQIGIDLAKVSKGIESGPGSEELWGLRVTRVLIRTIEMTDPEAEKSRTAKYTAQRQAEVVEIAAEAEAGKIKKIRAAEGTAEAGYIRKLSKEAVKQGPVALKLIDQETQTRVAKEAGTVIMQMGSSAGTPPINPIDAAILKQLEELNQSGKAAPAAKGGKT